MRVSLASRIGGGEAWPPGFRFHPTDEELVLYYLKRKICRKRLQPDIIRETDVYKWDPEELPGQSILKTGDRQWFFFSPRDRKYPNGARSNRATHHGYWKATGKDRNVSCNSRIVGVKKTLVFYRGRAPNGERTDWVMHEYTLDEEELKRCQNVQDYYALYKVFKKSGPGPKNGEQYGAPFREEEWADDECPEVNTTVESEIPVKQGNEVVPVADVSVNDQSLYQLNDFEGEILKPIEEEPLLNQPHAWDDARGQHKVIAEEETQSTLVDPSLREVVYPEPMHPLPPSSQHYNEQTSFDFTQSAISRLEARDVPEVTSAPNNCGQTPQLCEEDFLEIDDLIGPEPTFPNIENPVENVPFEELDGLSELDLYHDAAMFLRDMGPIDQVTVSNTHMSNFGSDMVSQVNYHLLPQPLVNQVDFQLQPQALLNPGDYPLQQPQSLVNPGDYQLQPHSLLHQVNYQWQPHSVSEGQINTQMWMHDQSTNGYMAESNLGTFSLPTSGVVYANTNNTTEANQNQTANEGDGDASWISSTLWAFLESIPTTPASASESPLVNRAFERMSSFSRVRINVTNTNVSAGNGASAARIGGKRGFLFLSILGVLCAILWVLVGSTRVLGRFVYS